jgi:hypothetical protein
MARIRSIKPEFWRTNQDAWTHARSALYIIQEKKRGPLKVGIAGHPIRRLSMLQCGNPRKLHLRAVYEGTDEACMFVERWLLEQFEGSRIIGEWIHADLDDVLIALLQFEEDIAG